MTLLDRQLVARVKKCRQVMFEACRQTMVEAKDVGSRLQSLHANNSHIGAELRTVEALLDPL